MFGEGRNLRFFVGLGAVILLLIFVIVLIVHHGGGSSKVPKTQKTLMSYTNDSNAVVTETIVGPVNASQDHDKIQISVTNQTATIQVSKGYDNNIIANKTYPMTTTSFGEFLSALNKAGYTLGNTAANLKDDRGYCPTGQRYIYEVQDGSTSIERFWATSCGGTKTYKGNVDLTNQLFQAQIPDYNNLVNSTDFEPLLVDL